MKDNKNKATMGHKKEESSKKTAGSKSHSLECNCNTCENKPWSKEWELEKQTEGLDDE